MALFKNLVHSPKSLRIGTSLDTRSRMRLLQPLFALFATTDDRELAKVVEYLKEENRILREKLPDRITAADRERARLIKLGKKIGSALKDLITIVSYRTFARWVANEGEQPAAKKSTRKPGRPRTADDIRELVVRLANRPLGMPVDHERGIITRTEWSQRLRRVGQQSHPINGHPASCDAQTEPAGQDPPVEGSQVEHSGQGPRR